MEKELMPYYECTECKQIWYTATTKAENDPCQDCGAPIKKENKDEDNSLR